jgi:hypothetical protein
LSTRTDLRPLLAMAEVLFILEIAVLAKQRREFPNAL